MNHPPPPLMKDVLKLVPPPDFKPSPDSSLYRRFMVEDLTGGGTRQTLIGCKLMLNDGDMLVNALNRPNETTATAAQGTGVHEVVIACDTLVLNASLIMPSRNVIIHARRLEVGPGGKIDLSAPNYSNVAANSQNSNPGGDGLAGWNAGTLRLYVDELAIAGSERAIFVANGGNGQTPGKGEPGKPGNSVPYRTECELKLKGYSFKGPTFKFDFAAIGYELSFDQAFGTTDRYFSNRSGSWEEQKSNPKDFLKPTNGSNAIAAGKPGEPGDGGALYSNRADRLTRFGTGLPGQAGTLQGKDSHINSNGNYVGGAPGTPNRYAFHRIVINTSYWDSSYQSARTANRFEETWVSAGNDAPGLIAPKRAQGTPGQVTADGSEYFWLHPLQVRAVLDYVRDVYLSGLHDLAATLLAPYDKAFKATCNKTTAAAGGYLPWLTTATESLGGLAAEVAAVANNLNSRRDYFGNLAGHLPLLSLQATAAKFDLDIEVAIRTMLLADWVTDVEKSAGTAAAAMQWASQQAAKERSRAEQQLAEAETTIAKAQQTLENLHPAIEAAKLEAIQLEARLRLKAQDRLEDEAKLRLLGKIAGAACMVIPYGQPILGSVGGVISDLAGADFSNKPFPSEALKAVSKDIGDEIKKIRDKDEKADRDKKEDTAKKVEDDLAKTLETNLEAGAQRRRSAPITKDPAAAAAATKAAKEARAAMLQQWETVGGNLGKFSTSIYEGISGLTVTQSAIDAALGKLKADSPEWAAVAKKIEGLNGNKETVLQLLNSGLQLLAQAVSTISTSSASIAVFNRSVSANVSALSVDAVQALQKMKATARQSVARTLYNLAKSYESQIFQPAPIDWSILQVYDYVKRTLTPLDTDKLDWATLSSPGTVAMLKTLFENQKLAIWHALEANGELARAKDYKTPLTLSARQTPAALAELNGPQREVVLNPFALRLIAPNKQRHWLVDVDIDPNRLKFVWPEGEEKARIVEIVVQVGRQGIVRCGGEHFGVSSTEGRLWSWHYDTEQKTLQKLEDRSSIADAFAQFFPTSAPMQKGDGSTSRRSHLQAMLSGAPLWSDFIVQVNAAGQGNGALPVIEQLEFVLEVEAVFEPFNVGYTVIRTLISDPWTGVQFEGRDLNGIAGARGDFQFFFKRNAGPVTIKSLPEPDRAVAGVRVTGSKMVNRPEWQPLPLTMEMTNDDYLLEFETPTERQARLKAISPEAMTTEIHAISDASVAVTVSDDFSIATADIATAAEDISPVLYEFPDLEADVVGLIAEDILPDCEEVPGLPDWRLVRSAGLVGYVRIL